MNLVMNSHRNAKTLFENDDKYKDTYYEIIDVLENISDDELIREYNLITRSNKKILSEPINKIIKNRLISKGWKAESAIFSDSYYNKEKRFRLDFAKNEISVEVAFNHSGVISWNLLKPVIASELNHVKKAIQTSAGIIICATDEMKKQGGFDNAVGSYETINRYLVPMYNISTSPLLIIGIVEPESFYVNRSTHEIICK